MMHTVLGIDLGTQNLKVVFFDYERSEVAASESAPLTLHQDDAGVAEQQSHCWLHALHDALAKVDPDVRRTAAAIAVSGQQHGFVAVDQAAMSLMSTWSPGPMVEERVHRLMKAPLTAAV